MKTIELPDELADTLVTIGKELAAQDNLGTSWPIWYVTEIKRRVVPRDRADGRDRLDLDIIDTDELCETCAAAYEEGESLDDNCDSCPDDMFYYYEDTREFTSYGSEFFLTQKACQEYIDANAYHFNKPKPYAGSAFRNHEIQPIIHALILAAGEKIPTNHY